MSRRIAWQIQQAVVGDSQDAAGPAQGAQGSCGDVAGARGDVDQLVQQPGAGVVGQVGLSELEAAGGLGQRPRPAHSVRAALDRRRHTERLLDIGLLLPAGVSHRHAAKLCAQERHLHRHHLVRLRGHRAKRGPGAARTRRRLLHQGPLHRGRSLAQADQTTRRVQAQGALLGDTHHLAHTERQSAQAQGGHLRLSCLQDADQSR